MATIANRNRCLNARRIHRIGAKRAHATSIPRWYLLSDIHRLNDPVPLLKNLPRGAAVIVRHPDPRQLLELCKRIVPQAHALHIRVLVAGDPRVAVAGGADGIHLSEQVARRGPPRPRIAKPDWLITAAAHGRRALARARGTGAHAILLSPVFPTDSHPEAQALGLLRFSKLARASRRPVIALGGIDARTAQRLRLSPAVGIAAIGLWRS